MNMERTGGLAVIRLPIEEGFDDLGNPRSALIAFENEEPDP